MRAPELHPLKVGLSTCMIQGGKTGVAQYALSLVRALLALPNGPSLTLFVLEGERRLFEFAAAAATIVPVPERFRPPIKNILWHQLALPRLIKRLGLEVVHVPSYRRLIWSKPCAKVATIHDLAPFHVPGKYDAARMFYGKVIVRALAHRQDRIIAVSDHTRVDVQRFFGISPQRVQVVLNGVDHERFSPGDSSAARAETAKRWQLNRPFFLYVSRLEHPAKNHVRLISAFSEFKRATGSDWVLVLGGSDWHGAAAIYEAAGASPVREDIRFLGFVADEDLPILYRAAGAVVYPSLFEGFGFPPVEAMACGCPVLSSRRGALREVVEDAAGVLEPENIGQMQLALSRVASDPVWREQLRRAGLRNAQRFSWSENAIQVLRCYQLAVGRLEPG